MEQYPSDNFIPQREPNEVTLEYVAEPKPYVAYYVQDRPLPGKKPETAAQEPPAKTRRKGHRGLKIFLICLAAVLVLAGGLYAAWWFGLLPDRFYGGDHGDYYDDPDYYYYYGELDESAEPELPVVSADDGVRLVYADGHGDALTIQEIYRRVNPSTVTVVTELPRGASVGTGVILTEDGYIVTNAHVIADGQSVLVVLADARQYEAELVGFDSAEDLAVLKAVDAEDLPTAVLGDSDECWVGDTVYAIGNPLGVELRGTLTQGIISAIDRRVTMDGKAMTMLQTTAALNNGNSGGPLINEYGQVIGINTMKMSNSIADAEAATVEGLGFAVPTGRAVTVINDILSTGAFHGIPSIGVYVAEEQQPDGTYRPVIDSVTENFGAEAAGLQRGDVILSADGTAVYSNYDLLRARRAHIVGETITLTVQRDGQTLDVEVYLYPVIEE